MYKGRLRDGKELAVKILKSSNDAWKEFLLEIEMATTLKHKNIISLVGFCFTKDSFFLVYDFLSRGSLEENLHGGYHFDNVCCTLQCLLSYTSFIFLQVQRNICFLGQRGTKLQLVTLGH